MKKVLIFGLFTISTAVSAQSGAERELQKAINQTGNSCPQVTQVFHSGNSGSSMMFSVACNGGQTYMVKVNKDGTGNVLSCRMLEKIGSQCFKKF